VAGISPDLGHRELTFADKLRGIRWDLIALITAIACLGFATLYSAANGDLQPWSEKQMMRFAFALVPMTAAALIDIRHWFRLAYWIYAGALALVIERALADAAQPRQPVESWIEEFGWAAVATQFVNALTTLVGATPASD